MSGIWWHLFGDFGSVRVFHVDLAPDVDREAEAVSWLDTAEAERWRRYRHPSPKRRFALCRSALRHILCRRLDCDNGSLAFSVSEYGKPSAEVGDKAALVSFNVSHSGMHGLIALASRGHVGVDVEERVRRRNLGILLEAVLSPIERAELTALRGDSKLWAFLDMWTVKEALSKARGMGISLDMSSLEVPEAVRRGAASGVFRFADMPAVEWQVESFGTEDFAAALAYELGERDSLA